MARRTTTNESEKQCLFPGCVDVERTRGLCNSHFASMKHYVKTGVATEEDLMKRGLLLAPRRRGDGRGLIFAVGSKVKGTDQDEAK